MKKVAKKIIKKSITAKKSKAVKSKPIIAKKRVINKKTSQTSKVRFFKPIGIFAAIGGALGMIVLVFVGLTSLTTPDAEVKPVLGAATTINSEVVAVRPTVKTPTNVTTSITAKGVFVSWTGSAEADSYIVYRKSGLLGSKVQIAKTIRPTIYKDGNAQGWPKTTQWPLGYYIDTAASKNSYVTYYVVATRDYCLLNATGYCGTAGSGMAAGKMTWNNLSYTNTATFNVYSLSAKSISVDAKMDTTKRYYMKVSCNDGSRYCHELSKDNLLSTNGQLAGRPYTYRIPLTYLNKKNGYHKFILSDLQIGTTYKVEISLLTPMGFTDSKPGDGSLYETIIGTTKSITTSSTITAPAVPTGLRFNGMMRQDDGGMAGTYKWDVPEAPVDGYDMAMSCQSNKQYYQTGVASSPSTWSGSIEMKDISRLSSGYATIAYGFDQYDLGTGRGLCTMNLTPFNLNTSGGKVIGKTATMMFGDATSKTLLEVPEVTGLAYNGQYNSGGVVWITADVPDVAPEGYRVSLDCQKNGVITKTLKDYVPNVKYITTSNPTTGATINKLEMDFVDFGVGNGMCLAYITGFNYDFMGDKIHLGISSPFEFTN